MENKQQYQEFGKLQPQATNIEEAILGSLMLESHSYFKVCDILKSEVFYKEEHKEIFTVIEKLNTEGKPVDIITVTDELRNEGKLEFVGGAYYVSQLQERVTSSANIEYHARVIVEKYILRELIRFSNNIMQDAFEETTDVFELQERAVSELINIQNIVSNDNTYHIKEVIPQAMIEVEAANTEGQQVGIRSAFSVINENFGGYIPKLFYLIAGRPGMGKSTFVRNEIHNFARQDISGVYFSLEMTKEEILKAMVSADKEIYYDRLIKGGMTDVDWNAYQNSLADIESLNIYINDYAGHTMNQIYLTAKRMKLQHNIGYIIIDHLQLIRGDKDLRLRMSDISARCKVMAKELDLPVLGLSQLSREVEKRSNKKPQNSDLRESGTLEQDADHIMFIWRPEYYDILEDSEGNSTIGAAKFITSKFRQGAIKDFTLTFEGQYQRFTEYKEIIIKDEIEPSDRKDF
jgi:replicative DNA helicase